MSLIDWNKIDTPENFEKLKEKYPIQSQILPHLDMIQLAYIKLIGNTNNEEKIALQNLIDAETKYINSIL
jgi:hypothetical protein